MKPSAITHASPFDVCQRIGADFEEMPDLVVTTKQAARFWALDESIVVEALKVLVQRGCLVRVRDTYRRR